MKKKLNYWTEMGLAAKKALQDQKIMDSKTKHYRHPQLKDLVFKSKTKSLNLTKEEWKERFTQEKAAKEERMENLPYSRLHNKLILGAYAGIANSLKKAAEKSAHEERIKRIILRSGINEAIRLWNRQKNCPNLLVVQQKFSKDKGTHDSMVIPTSNSINTLYDIAMNMRTKLTIGSDTFTGIEIWDRKDYIDRMKGDKTKIWKYYIPRDRDVDKAA